MPQNTEVIEIPSASPPPMPDDWPARLRAAAEESARRRRRRVADRREAAQRRAHGLIDRNALRLAEARARAG